MLAGTQLQTPGGVSTVLPDIDFETYSEAGFWFDCEANKWRTVRGSPKNKSGLLVVGTPAYAAHPTTEVLSLSYNLKRGDGPRLWLPGTPDPEDLLEYVRSGGLLEAWNTSFEYWIWREVCYYRLGWPDLPWWRLRDAAAKARAYSLPGKLALAGQALELNTGDLKQSDGTRLINKFSKPRQPSKKDPSKRNTPARHPGDAAKLYAYNLQDIAAEAAVSARCPDLSETELNYWLMDQSINVRGAHIDREALGNCVDVVNQAFDLYTNELQSITGGAVQSASELQKLLGWLAGRGLTLANLNEETVDSELRKFEQVDKADAAGIPAPPGLAWYGDSSGHAPECRRVLEIRSTLAASSVKKLHSINLRLSSDGRLRDLFVYHGAHTGRVTGAGPQPTNMPGGGPPVKRCPCERHYGAHRDVCPWCGMPGGKPVKWTVDAAEDALDIIKSRNLDTIEQYFGDAVAAVSGSLRALFVAAPGHDLICADYNAIEAVVTAVLAGEQWRLEVFRTHGKIYEASASAITNVPLDEFFAHKEQTGEHHPLRNRIGKFAELASGFGGWIGAWKQFGADEYLTDDEIKDAVIKWRKASPAIVELWGGQVRKVPGRWSFVRDMHGLEGAAVMAVANPGREYATHGVAYFMRGDVLFCRLRSGRCLTYHQPRLTEVADRFSGERIWQLSYMGYNRDSNRGPVGWMRIDTYGGRLCENVVQATARDIMFHAMLNLERAGYPIVLHVYDEAVGEVPEGQGSIEEFESIMIDLPDWCRDWPIRAVGGWRGKRYRKE